MEEEWQTEVGDAGTYEITIIVNDSIDQVTKTITLEVKTLNNIPVIEVPNEIEVVEGRVLLTGSVKKKKHRVNALKLAWKVLGVREVINEIDVTKKGGIKQYLIDVKIKTQMRYKVITDKEISSINYNFEVVNGNLYIIGIAKNKKELKKVVKHANDIKGILKVVSHVIMKNDPRRKKYQRKLQEKND